MFVFRLLFFIKLVVDANITDFSSYVSETFTSAKPVATGQATKSGTRVAKSNGYGAVAKPGSRTVSSVSSTHMITSPFEK